MYMYLYMFVFISQTCANCKTRQKCKKAFSIWKFPKILILHLKRFDPLAAFPTKLTTDVDFPLNNLDLSAYASEESPGTVTAAFHLHVIRVNNV